MSRNYLNTPLPLLALLAAPAYADTNTGADIVVTATGMEQPRADVGQSITIITRNRLEQLQSTSISDVLATVPGVTVSRNGGMGSATSLFIRGANSGQTLVLVDGVRLNDPSSTNGAFDFGALTTGNIDNVEVLRGPNSVVWGSQAIGGVINIRNTQPTEQILAALQAEFGYRNAANLSGNISGKAGPVSLSIGGSFAETDGISSLADNVEKDGSRIWSTNVRIGIDLADSISLDLRAYYNRTKLMSDDAYETLPLSDPRTDAKRFVGYAGLNFALLDSRLQNRISYSHTNIKREGTNPFPFSFDVYSARGEVDRFEYRGSYALADAATIIFGAEHERTRAHDYEPNSSPTPSNQKGKVTSFFGEAILKPIAGLTLTGGIRHDDYSLYGGVTTFGANAAYSPNGGATTVRATYAEGFRAPIMIETTGPFGNPTLLPETAKSYDIGVEQRLVDGAILLSATYYDRRTRNLITFDGATNKSQNIGFARAKGVELGIALNPTDTLAMQANYTLVDAKDKNGVALLKRPRHNVNASIDWKSPIKLKLGVSLALHGDTMDFSPTGYAPEVLEGYSRADIRATYPVSDKVEFYGRIENLFDASYQTALGFNTPGRSAYAGIRVKY